MSNLAEYIAGTDYLDPASNLKLGIAQSSAVSLSFNAVSNRTYTVQYSGTLNPSAWVNLVDIFAKSTTRPEAVTAPKVTTNRFYRVVTPIQRPYP
jgi:hypothetical protein